MRRKAASVLLSILIFQTEIFVYAQGASPPADLFSADTAVESISADAQPSARSEGSPTEAEEFSEEEFPLFGTIEPVDTNVQTEESLGEQPEAAFPVEEPADDAKEDASSQSSALTVDEMIQGSVEWMRKDSDNILNEKFLSSVSSTYTDWRVFTLGRLGIADNYTGFLSAADIYVRSQYAAHPETGLSKDSSTATEFHRLAIALLAAGGDPTQIGGQDLIADGTYNCLTGAPWKQGINGGAWALLALDSKGYETPASASYDRDAILSYLLEHEIRGGGWDVNPASSTPGADVTGTVVTALAPYCAANEKARDAANRALAYFQKKIKSTGSLEDCETTARAIMAYVSMGIDPASVKASSGKSLLDGLKGYYNEKNGGFRHADSTTLSNDMATDQAVYSLIAYQRFLSGDLNLFDFRNPANTAQYVIQADGVDYVTDFAADTAIVLAPGTSAIEISNLPVGPYDAAAVTADGKTFVTSYRRANGNTPVDASIPVSDGTELSIQVSHRGGSSETWRLQIQMSGDAKVQAVKNKIAALPKADAVQLSDETAVNEAKKAYDALTGSEKEEITNYEKLEQLLTQLQKLKQEEQSSQNQKRKELKQKINALDTSNISGKVSINQYLLELEELGDWDEKAALENKLKKALSDIEKREAAVDALDSDIWEKISPLHISQKDAKTVKSLMARYAALSEEERALLKNKTSLLDAADIIDSLEDEVIPAKIFANLQTTKGTFTYTGTLPNQASYTLTFDGKTVQAAKDIDARVRCPSAKDAENAIACVEFLQNGSMNGTVTFRAGLNVPDGTYNLYWYNADKAAVQSAKSAQVSSQTLSMEISMGGKYWLSTGVVRLSGQNPTTPQATLAATATPRPGTVSANLTPAPTRTAGPTTAATKPVQQTKAATPSASAAKSSSASSEKTITVKGENGVLKAADFEKIKGLDKNLQTQSIRKGNIRYTLTFNGADVTKAVDFPYEIQTECENSTFMQQLGDDPLILCMEKMKVFPGKMLLSLETELEDDTYLLFAYNPEEMKAEYVKKAEVTKGCTQFTISEGGDYFLAKRAKAGSLLDDAQAQEAGMGTFSDMLGDENTAAPALSSMIFLSSFFRFWKYGLSLLLGLGVGAGGIFLYKKMKGRKTHWVKK